MPAVMGPVCRSLPPSLSLLFLALLLLSGSFIISLFLLWEYWVIKRYIVQGFGDNVSAVFNVVFCE